MNFLGALIEFAASVNGIFSLMALVVLGSIVYVSLFARGKRQDVIKAIETKNPKIVEKVNNEYGIDISKLGRKEALRATETKIRHDTVGLISYLAFGTIIFLATLVLIYIFFAPKRQDKNAELTILLPNLQGVLLEQRIAIARQIYGENYSPDIEDLLRIEAMFDATPVVPHDPSGSTVDEIVRITRDEAVRAGPCDNLSIRGGILLCNGNPEFININRNKPLRDIDAIVFHYTATSITPNALQKIFERRIASYHILIMRDGSFVQFVNLENRAEHLGRGGSVGGIAVNNSNSIAIAFDNLGAMKKMDDVFAYAASTDGSVAELSPRDNPVFRDGYYWEPYTDLQLSAASRIVSLIQETYGPLREIGHSELAPKLKMDPGPLFDLDTSALL